MSISRRDLIKSAGFAIGAMALPVWLEGSAAAAAAEVFTKLKKDDLADAALATAKRLVAGYADIRIDRYRTESVSTRERQVLNVSSSQNFGFGVRVLVIGVQFHVSIRSSLGTSQVFLFSRFAFMIG